MPLVFGGVIAAGLGFAAAEMNLLNTRADTDAIQRQITDQQKVISELVPADLSGLENSVADVQASISSVSDQISTLETRLTVLEDRPVVVAEDGTVTGPPPEYLDELAALKASVEEQKTEISRLLENALSVEEATAQSAREAAIQTASAKLIAALGSGAPYQDVIEDLSEAGIGDLPPELTEPAEDGVVKMSELQSDFPDAARSGLAAARASGVDAGTGGVAGFLRRQLGARSVAPREGSDPDAVLSRAEAALRSGNAGDALSELEALPSEVQSAMDAWIAPARARAGAEQAVQDLSERLTAN